jgi:hypothetical protein
MWSEPVPKDSSPQMESRPASIKFPKNFHPAGLSLESLVAQNEDLELTGGDLKVLHPLLLGH